MAMTFLNNKISVDGTWTNLTTVSCSLWFKVNTSKSTNRLCGSADQWEVRITNDWTSGSYRFANEFFASDARTPAVSTTVIAAGTWYHAVATTTNGSTSSVYINGVFEASIPIADDPPTLSQMSLGNRDSAPADQGLAGVLDDIRIYNRILSAAEAQTIYACRGTDGIVNGLRNRWLLDEGAEGVAASGAGTIRDLAGNNHGTPADSPVYTGSFLKFRRAV